MASWVYPLLLVYLWQGGTAANEEQSPQSLYHYLFDDYQRQIRPVANDSAVMTITVQFWFKQILRVLEADQVLRIYCWLEEYWTDEYLTWNATDFGGIQTMHVPSNTIWRPDLLVYNSANMNIQENEMETNAIISHDGAVTLFRSVITDITCNLDLTYFPFDQQVCYLMLASWSFDGSKLLLAPIQGVDNLQFYIGNTEWSMTDFKFRLDEKMYDCCDFPFPDISYYFVLNRNPAYYILSLVIPSAFITIVTIVGFFTPHSSTGENTEKVSLGVTALLSMAIIMMMVADEMPATSKVMPLIGKYYIGLIFIIFAAAFSTTLTLSLQMRGNAGVRLSAPLRRFFFVHVARVFCVAVLLPHYRDHDDDGDDDEPSATTDAPSRREQASALLKKAPLEEEEATAQANGAPSRLDALLPVAEAPSPRFRAAFSQLVAHDRIYLRNRFGPPVAAKRARSESLRPDSAATTTGESTAAATATQLRRVARLVHSINDELLERARLEDVVREWQQLARILERILMIFFIGATALFAFFVLGNRSGPLRITDELMTRVKNTND